MKVMITKNSNAKMMLMSTVAAVVFSFVFTTSANAQVSAPAKSNLEVRVKSAPKSNVGVRVKTPQKSNLEIRVKESPRIASTDITDYFYYKTRPHKEQCPLWGSFFYDLRSCETSIIFNISSAPRRLNLQIFQLDSYQ